MVARSVATDRYVELTPVYAGGAKMEDGAEIGVDRTASPVDFDQVLATINEFATGIAGSKKATKAMKRFIDRGAAALEGTGAGQPEHPGAAGGVNSLSGQRKDFATTWSLDILVATIAENDDTVRTFVTRSPRQQPAGRRARQLPSALRALDRAVTVVAQFAVDNRDEIVETFDDATKVFRTMLKKRGASPRSCG